MSKSKTAATVTVNTASSSSDRVCDSPASEQPQVAPKPRVPRINYDPVAKFSNFITEWTPFLLVWTYLAFSICLYMLFPGTLFPIFWFIYLLTNFYIAGNAVMEAILSISAIRESRKTQDKLAAKDWKFPTPDDDLLFLDIVIVAYLPNEKDIIVDRAIYAAEKIMYPHHKLRVNIVYNTPKPMLELETRLWALEAKYPHLRIHKVPGSTSKADNLNYFLTLPKSSDVISIFDCDHYPHPYGPRHAVERMIGHPTVDIVQGRCVVFNSDESFMSAMVAVEFDKIYAVSHPGRAAMWNFGLFCGSNGYWRADLIRELKMHGHMLTEDIDSALRAFGRGCEVVHDLNCVSYELAPTTFPVLWKQRLRWAQGWAQASWVHAPKIWQKTPPGQPKRTGVQRFGLFSLLAVRESSYYLVSQYTCFVFSIICLDFPKSGFELFRLVFFPFPLSLWFFVISVSCLLGTLLITNYAKCEFVRRHHIIVFSILYPAYLILNSIMGLYGHARQLIRYTKWNPTVRK